MVNLKLDKGSEFLSDAARLNENDICKDIANLHDNILSVGIIENQQLFARFTKIKEPGISEERTRMLFAQPEIIISICRTNEEFFGTLRYLIVCFADSDIVFFPATIGNDVKIMYVRMQRSFRGEEVMEKVYNYLENSAVQTK